MLAHQSARILVAGAVVLFWVLLGRDLHLDPNSYLLVGIPLLVVFQLCVARRPIRELWLKHQPAFRLTKLGCVAAAVAMIYPAYGLIEDWRHETLPERLWLIAATLGAIPLGFTVGYATRRTWLSLLVCFAIAGTLCCAEMLLGSMVIHLHHPRHPHDAMTTVRIIARNFLLYMPVCFMIEEVFFRGGLDSFMQREGDRHGWLTAVLLSAFWGWWHLAIFPKTTWMDFAVLVIALPLIHLIPGVTFSYTWRMSGSLLAPAVVHGFIDSFRNAVM